MAATALTLAIDAHADAIVSTVPTGLSPVAITVDSVTNKIYVANSGDSSITIIDGATDSTSSDKLPFSPQGLAVNPVTNKIYVGGNNDSLAVLDGLTGKTAIIDMGMQYAPQMIVNPVTDKIYVSGNPVLILNGANNSVSELKGQPDSLGVLTVAAIYPAANSIYLLGNAAAPAIAIINGSADSIAWLVATNFVYEAVNPLTGTFLWELGSQWRSGLFKCNQSGIRFRRFDFQRKVGYGCNCRESRCEQDLCKYRHRVSGKRRFGPERYRWSDERGRPNRPLYLGPVIDDL